MRELLPRVYTAPADLRQKVFIIDEVQRIKEGWDVLLKTLEEPPPDVLFIFCTTDPSGIRPAVVCRLQRFTFRPLPEKQITAKLRRIAEAEGRSITDDALDLIAQRAAGGMRDAESMLDQVISSGVEQIDADTVRDLLGLAEMDSVDRFVAALAGGDSLDGIRTARRARARRPRPRRLCRPGRRAPARTADRGARPGAPRRPTIAPETGPRRASARRPRRQPRRRRRLPAAAGAGAARRRVGRAPSR